jgi:hypothetical protein
MSSTRLVAFSFLFAACGSDPVQYSAPVGIELKAKSGDVAGNVVAEQKDISTESGNPYGAFVNTATAKLNGHAPSRLEIDQLTLTLGAQSTGVTTLDQVLTGDVDVAFLVNDSNNTYDAGHVMNPTGAGPVTMDPSLDWSLMSADDRTKMLNGSFKVSLRGSASTGFQTKGANASLQVTFTFTAFE